MSDMQQKLAEIRKRCNDDADISPAAMPAKIELLKKLLAQASPGPWHSCGDGECSCKIVSTADHPVAQIVHGDWGDDYPSIRVVGCSLEAKAEAYMEQITYGHIPDEVATANARLIALLRVLAPVFLEKLAGDAA